MNSNGSAGTDGSRKISRQGNGGGDGNGNKKRGSNGGNKPQTPPDHNGNNPNSNSNSSKNSNGNKKAKINRRSCHINITDEYCFDPKSVVVARNCTIVWHLHSDVRNGVEVRNAIENRRFGNRSMKIE